MLHADHFTVCTATPIAEAPLSIHDRADEAKRQSIEAALRETGGNKAAAARRLGMSRNGLSKMMTRLYTRNST
ncbi:MAG: helix-turn-helix domain-containing protein [Thermoanaerobaculia bacterium]